MRLKRIMLLSLSCFCLINVTACGSKEDTSATTVADYEEDYDYQEDDYSGDEGEGEEEETQGQKLTVSLRQDNTNVNTDKPVIPVDEFKKYGKVVKDKNGYKILGTDGYYISEAMLNVDGNCFYFDENGFLKDDVFVPVKSTDGKVVTMYVHNYQYQYGWIEVSGKKYYIDEQDGRLENTSKMIEGEMYYFDNLGRTITEEKYKAAYVFETEVAESEEDISGIEGEISDTETITDNNEAVVYEIESMTESSDEVDTVGESESDSATLDISGID